ncbi:MAG: hypothetical protein JJU12_02270 [Chlamydiales bacterium]|nr:hypothetical protein [Chlamydiales bacterium]
MCYLRPGRGDQAKPQPLSNPSFFSAVSYKSNLAPHSLTFDEAALFWRLRLGEGIPNRRWHKPLDPSKTWHEVKAGLDQKIEASHKNYEKGLFARFFSKIVKVIKQSFLLE